MSCRLAGSIFIFGPIVFGASSPQTFKISLLELLSGFAKTALGQRLPKNASVFVRLRLLGCARLALASLSQIDDFGGHAAGLFPIGPKLVNTILYFEQKQFNFFDDSPISREAKTGRYLARCKPQH